MAGAFEDRDPLLVSDAGVAQTPVEPGQRGMIAPLLKTPDGAFRLAVPDLLGGAGTERFFSNFARKGTYDTRPEAMDQIARDTFDAAGAFMGPGYAGAAAGAVPLGAFGSAGGRGIKAWHGSPHRFDKFSLDKIGSGEGAQAYGHGLYFAENPNVAKSYQRSVPYLQMKRSFRDVLPDDADFDEVLGMIGSGQFTPHQERVLQELADNDWLGFDYPSQAVSAAYSGRLDDWDPTPSLRSAIDDSGALYEVKLNVDEDELLDWDKPISEQSMRVREALGVTVPNEADLRSRLAEIDKKLAEHSGNKSASEMTFEEFFDIPKEIQDLAVEASDIRMKLDSGVPEGHPFFAIGRDKVDSMTGARVARPQIGQEVAAAEALRAAGIKGIKYLDEASRARGEGSRNFVIFDDQLVEITAIDGEKLRAMGVPIYSLDPSQLEQPIQDPDREIY